MITDTSPMPFGKYGPKPKGTGQLMQDVPASYLNWLWHDGLKEDKQSEVAEYIRKNLSVLETEFDGEW